VRGVRSRELPVNREKNKKKLASKLQRPGKRKRGQLKAILVEALKVFAAWLAGTPRDCIQERDHGGERRVRGKRGLSRYAQHRTPFIFAVKGNAPAKKNIVKHAGTLRVRTLNILTKTTARCALIQGKKGRYGGARGGEKKSTLGKKKSFGRR